MPARLALRHGGLAALLLTRGFALSYFLSYDLLEESPGWLASMRKPPTDWSGSAFAARRSRASRCPTLGPIRHVIGDTSDPGTLLATDSIEAGPRRELHVHETAFAFGDCGTG
jgi:hypothetical protein